MSAPRRSGFTLAELLIGLVVTSITMAAVAMSVIGVQRSYQTETSVKVVTENGRTALEFFERVLPLAGYGVDPRIAFDLTTAGTVPGAITRDNYRVPGVLPATIDVRTDDLAFRYRDPAWLRAGRLNAGNNQITVDTPLGVDLPAGKLMLVACRGGFDFNYVRVTTAAVATDFTVSVANATTAPDPFVANTNNCLTLTGTSSPWVLMVHEQRLRIVNLGNRPWLVAFRDLRADVTNLGLNNFDPIASDIETFQVAFGMNRPTTGGVSLDAAGNNNWIIGDSFSPLENMFWTPGAVLTTLPTYDTSYVDASRFTARPANIRSVHIALVARSSRVEPSGRRLSKPDDLFNWDAPAAVEDGYFRSTFHTAIPTNNLLSRSFFIPSLRSAGDSRDLNSWGG